MESLGQFFTKNKLLKNKVRDLIKNNPKVILEPSMGRGDLVTFVRRKFPNCVFHLYEIDKTIKPLPTLSKKDINWEDFLKASTKDTYSTIIGNPPYVRVKGSLNLYLQFIEKCYKLLVDGGELIFIVPSDFGKLTSSKKLIKDMLNVGCFTHAYYPNSEKLFVGASVDVMVFRYVRGETQSSNNVPRHLKNKTTPTVLIKDYFDVWVGIVSGRDKIYKHTLGDKLILVKENERHRFIIPTVFPTGNKEVDDYLLTHKESLLGRRIKKFNEDNWFEWGALRNYKKVLEGLGKECLYVSTLTRSKKVCFKGKVELFSGNLLILIGKDKHKDKYNLDKLMSYLNSDEFKKEHTYSGRFKIGQSLLANTDISHFV